MSAVLQDICDRIAKLRHDDSLLGQLRTLAPDLIQANIDFDFYKQEVCAMHVVRCFKFTQLLSSKP